MIIKRAYYLIRETKIISIGYLKDDYEETSELDSQHLDKLNRGKQIFPTISIILCSNCSFIIPLSDRDRDTRSIVMFTLYMEMN